MESEIIFQTIVSQFQGFAKQFSILQLLKSVHTIKKKSLIVKNNFSQLFRFPVLNFMLLLQECSEYPP
jgi:hypothetical protein